MMTHDEMEKRLDEWVQRHPRARVRFNVAPRYTAGSPAMVPMKTALRVAEQERRGYHYAADARYGLDDVERARRLGVKGIVTATREVRGKVQTLDLFTGEAS